MDFKAVLKTVQRAVATVVAQQKPLLPCYIQDLEPSERPSPPPSPLEEVVVVRDAFPLTRGAVSERLQALVLTDPMFSIV